MKWTIAFYCDLWCSNFILGIYVALKKPVNTPFLADFFPIFTFIFSDFKLHFLRLSFWKLRGGVGDFLNNLAK